MAGVRERLLWGALEGIFETSLNLAGEAKARRRGHADGYAEAAVDVAAALRALLDWHWQAPDDQAAPHRLQDGLLDLVLFLEENGRPPAQVIEGELVDVTG